MNLADSDLINRHYKSIMRDNHLASACGHTIFALYNGARRRYHGIGHIAAGLRLLDEYQTTGASVSDALWFAWFLHDAVWEPDAPLGINELASAILADGMGQMLGKSALERQEIHLLILATDHQMRGITEEHRLIQDVDLASLGLPPEEFLTDTTNIRREQSHIDDAEFIQRSGKFLFGLVVREGGIYGTPWFRSKYEERARTNIEWFGAHVAAGTL